MGIKKKFRLQDSRDFLRLRHEGTVYYHPILILNTAPNTLLHNRYGFVTAKRLGNAAARNRIRRQLREATRLLHPVLRPGFDVVIVARQDIVDKSYHQISDVLQLLFQKAQLVGD